VFLDVRLKTHSFCI